MSEKESYDAAVEARQDITTHPDRPLPHMDKIGHYLGGMAYAVLHPHKSPPEPDDTSGDNG